MIHFTLDIEPKPKARPRVTKAGRAYTPKVTREFEKAIKTLSRVHILEPLKGAVALKVLFVHPRLKSEAKKRPERKYKTTRPDLSNLIKSLEDGLEGVAFKDDAQIVRIEAEKIHAALNEGAHIEVTLQEIENEQIGHYGAGGEGRALTREDKTRIVQDGHINVCGEGRASTRKERSVINRRRHREEQDEKHKQMSHERGIRKFEEARIKLASTEAQRKAEAEEKARLENEARQQRWREMEARYQEARERRSTNWRDYVYVSDDNIDDDKEKDDD